jgi:hypothetical protein
MLALRFLQKPPQPYPWLHIPGETLIYPEGGCRMPCGGAWVGHPRQQSLHASHQPPNEEPSYSDNLAQGGLLLASPQ